MNLMGSRASLTDVTAHVEKSWKAESPQTVYLVPEEVGETQGTVESQRVGWLALHFRKEGASTLPSPLLCQPS